MCGFLGFVSENNNVSRLADAIQLIKHRGPDSQDYKVYETDNLFVGFAHARLSIIDLTEAAKQPFASTCGN